MSTTPITTLRRGLAAAAASCAFVTVAACGAEVTPQPNDLTGAEPKEPLPTYTLADCLRPGVQPPVTTCPYPIRSGDQFSDLYRRMQHDDEHDGPGR